MLNTSWMKVTLWYRQELTGQKTQLYNTAVFQETEEFASDANAPQQHGVQQVHFMPPS